MRSRVFDVDGAYRSQRDTTHGGLSWTLGREAWPPDTEIRPRRHVAIQVGYARMWGRGVWNAFDDEDVELGYLQLRLAYQEPSCAGRGGPCAQRT